MEPAAKPSFAPGFISRLLLLGVFVLLFRFVYVVTSRGGSCASGDFCFSSTSAEFYSLPGGVSGGAAFVRVSDGSAISPELRHLWTSKNWRKAVEFYSSVFQDLIVEGFLSPTSKSLCVEAIAGHEVLALKEIGVADAVGIYKKKSPPLVVAGDILHQPFGDNSFDFVFVGRILDQIRRPADLAGEIARVLKPKGFLVLLTLSGGDLYSLHSLEVLFSCCKKVRSREINGPDSSKSLREIVFQKEEVIQIIKDKAMQTNDDVDPLIGGNLLHKCSIPAHKLQLLRSAEPLIEEEPQKPWISLNIKYLPSMVDMSFKQRDVYIDVGARSSVSSIGSWFKKQYPKQNKTFEIYAIEADRAFHGMSMHPRKGLRCYHLLLGFGMSPFLLR